VKHCVPIVFSPATEIRVNEQTLSTNICIDIELFILAKLRWWEVIDGFKLMSNIIYEIF